MLYLFHLLITCLCFFTFNVAGSGFSTTTVDEERKERFITNVDLKLLDEPATSTIECFDVNEDGMIALGHTGSSPGVISVYSSDGMFRYGYTFNCRTFYVEWYKDILNIYFGDELLASVSPSGEIINVSEVEKTVENNSYCYSYLDEVKRNVNNTEYEMRNCFLSSYSQLVKIDENGKETVLYSAQTSQNTQIGITIVVVIVFVGVLLIVGFYHKENPEHDTEKS